MNIYQVYKNVHTESEYASIVVVAKDKFSAANLAYEFLNSRNTDVELLGTAEKQEECVVAKEKLESN